MSEQSYPRMLVVVRRDLSMPAGKLGAQVAHACVRLITDGARENEDRYRGWFDPEKGNETKVVLSGKDELELRKIQKTCLEQGIPCALVTDAGKTVFNEPTVTCLGIGPVWEEEAGLFRRLRLYKDDLWDLDQVCAVVETVAYVDPDSQNIHNRFRDMDLENFLPEHVAKRMVERSDRDQAT